MLAANETVAEHFYWLEMPFLYRTHEQPDPEKIQELETFLQNFGYHMKVAKDGVKPKELQRMLDKAKGKPEEALLSTLTLRSMKRAKYTTECMGHFGLACKYYCHFTSPIRRYPDLLVHRAIKAVLAGEGYNPAQSWDDIGLQCSATERRADEATRDVENWLKCFFMKERIGEEFDGTISAVTGFGIFVALDAIYVEGLVHVSDLGQDYFQFDNIKHQMLGERTGQRYRLGDRVRVRLVRANLESNKIDFVLIGEDKASGGRRPSGARRPDTARAAVTTPARAPGSPSARVRSTVEPVAKAAHKKSASKIKPKAAAKRPGKSAGKALSKTAGKTTGKKAAKRR